MGSAPPSFPCPISPHITYSWGWGPVPVSSPSLWACEIRGPPGPASSWPGAREKTLYCGQARHPSEFPRPPKAISQALGATCWGGGILQDAHPVAILLLGRGTAAPSSVRGHRRTGWRGDEGSCHPHRASCTPWQSQRTHQDFPSSPGPSRAPVNTAASPSHPASWLTGVQDFTFPLPPGSWLRQPRALSGHQHTWDRLGSAPHECPGCPGHMYPAGGKVG